MKQVFKKPSSLTDVPTIYCPGCGHGIIHRLIAEVIDELDLRERTIGIAPVGCAVLAYDYWNFDVSEAPHGRTPSVATGIKRVHPQNLVFTYQGDGDLAAIGTAEIIHTAARGEKITTIFVNNANYGMTGGQMAPTTLINQKTTTSPLGRNLQLDGYPLRICELLSVIDGAKYLVRTAVNNTKNILKTKSAIKRAFQVQLENIGFSLVEILSACPINWGLSPIEANKWIEDVMSDYFKLGELKTPQ